MKMKKFFAAVLAVVMVLAVVTGCSKGSGKASADTQKKGMESTFKLKYKDSNGISDITLKSVAAGKEAAISINGSVNVEGESYTCLLYTSPSPRDRQKSRMPSSA